MYALVRLGKHRKVAIGEYLRKGQQVNQLSSVSPLGLAGCKYTNTQLFYWELGIENICLYGPLEYSSYYVIREVINPASRKQHQQVYTMSLDLHLRNIQKNAKSLRTLYFKPPGIFTNAIINKPEITRLIRDSDALERSLYTIDDKGEPHRIDGVNNYAETPSDEKTIIKIPDYSTQETPSTLIQLNDETEIPELLEKANDLVKRYPLEGLAGKLETCTQRYEQLQQSIAEYELLEQRQAEELRDHDASEDQLEEIAKEESRIHALKQILEQKQ